MQHTTAKHNPLTFYLRTLLYMFVALLLRLAALAPLACLFVFPAGSPLKLLALLCPVLLVLLVLPLRYSFAEALVQRDGRRYFSFDTALNMGNYGEKLAESLLHAVHVAKWGLPLFVMLIYGYYWYKEVDALTLLSTLTQLGRTWTETRCAVANFFLNLVGATPLTPPQNTLMDGAMAVLAVLGLGVAVWLYGAVRNSAARYVWAYADRNDHSPRKELRRRLERDIAAGLREPDVLERAAAYLPLYAGLRSFKLDTTCLSPEKTAEAIESIYNTEWRNIQ